MKREMTRRSFVKESVLSTAALALAVNSRAEDPAKPAAPTPSEAAGLPKGRIGKLEVSRLILGGNLLTHYTHSRRIGFLDHYEDDGERLTYFSNGHHDSISAWLLPRRGT